MLAIAVGANGQAKSKPRQPDRDGGTNVAVIVVSSAAKGAWATTKFTAKYIAKPVAKTIFLKAAPKVGVFLVKQTAKRALPLAMKLAVL